MSRQAACVHVVDDDDSLRKAVVRLLVAAGYEARGYASAGEFLLAQPAEMSGCVILDVEMPGPSGLDLQDALQQRDGLPVIFLTGQGDISMSVRAMKAGAVDFLTKPVERETLLAAVDAALERGARDQARQVGLNRLQARYNELTPREQAVLALVVQGKLNKQIAVELGIAERTVKAHRSSLMGKLQVESLVDLVRVADQLADGNAPN